MQLERKKIWSIYKEICTVQPPLGFLHGKMEFYAGNYIAPSMYLACRTVGKSEKNAGGGAVIMTRAYSAPLPGWDRIKWSAKYWVGQCSAPPPAPTALNTCCTELTWVVSNKLPPALSHLFWVSAPKQRLVIDNFLSLFCTKDNCE